MQHGASLFDVQDNSQRLVQTHLQAERRETSHECMTSHWERAFRQPPREVELERRSAGRGAADLFLVKRSSSFSSNGDDGKGPCGKQCGHSQMSRTSYRCAQQLRSSMTRPDMVHSVSFSSSL